VKLNPDEIIRKYTHQDSCTYVYFFQFFINACDLEAMQMTAEIGITDQYPDFEAELIREMLKNAGLKRISDVWAAREDAPIYSKRYRNFAGREYMFWPATVYREFDNYATVNLKWKLISIEERFYYEKGILL
jgi:hypothetical protein